MAEKFERENRYFVIKISDIDKFDAQLNGKVNDHFNEKMRSKIKRLMTELSGCFELAENLPDRKYVCVEHDWPEYEPVWNMIKSRVTGEDV